MATGIDFHLTDKRITDAVRWFKGGHTVNTVAARFKITPVVLRKHLKQSDIDWRQLRSDGMTNLQVDLLETIKVLDPKDKVTEGMKYLARYQKLDEGTEDTLVVDTAAIRMSIINDLSSK